MRGLSFRSDAVVPREIYRARHTPWLANRTREMQMRRRRTMALLRPPIPPYYQQVLNATARFREDEEYAVAIIPAQTACEHREVSRRGFKRYHWSVQSSRTSSVARSENTARLLVAGRREQGQTRMNNGVDARSFSR
jgi:hypothetical protein